LATSWDDWVLLPRFLQGLLEFVVSKAASCTSYFIGWNALSGLHEMMVGPVKANWGAIEADQVLVRVKWLRSEVMVHAELILGLLLL
jgi:hypothetical protein